MPVLAIKQVQVLQANAEEGLPSKLYRFSYTAARVPTTAATVITGNAELTSTLGEPSRHFTAVPVVHATVSHSSDPRTSPTDGVKLYLPKLSPEIVTVAEELAAAF